MRQSYFERYGFYFMIMLCIFVTILIGIIWHKRYPAAEKPETIKYYQDTRTEICFAVVFQGDQIMEVPCETIPDEILHRLHRRKKP